MVKGRWKGLDIVNLGVCLRDIAMHNRIVNVIVGMMIFVKGGISGGVGGGAVTCGMWQKARHMHETRGKHG
jgi:hypothetical protein